MQAGTFTSGLRIGLLLGVLTGVSAMAEKTGTPLVGTWGGDRANLVLHNTGGSIALDCATGTLTEPVRPDKSGHFSARGNWEKLAAGPQQADVAPALVPASFEGRFTGDVLHLTVTRAGEQQRLTLAKGTQVKLVRCL